MRKISLSFLLYVLVAFLSILSPDTSAQVPVLGPVDFGTGKNLPAGWTISDYKEDGNTWLMINTVYPSTGYSTPDASGGSHIVIDASATRYDYLQSPTIDFSSYQHGILKFGLWRLSDYKEYFYVLIDTDSDGDFDDVTRTIHPADSVQGEKWKLITIDLGSSINNKSSIKLRFRQSSYYEDIGPLRIDDITLYGHTPTRPADYFRTRTSGNWNTTAVWESSRDNVNWMPATLIPNGEANSITIRSTHTITTTTPLTVDQLTINNGGTLSLGHDLGLNDGAGDDLLVEEGGTLDLSTFKVITSGTIQLNGLLKTANTDGLCGSSTTSLPTCDILKTPAANWIIEYNAAGDQSVSRLSEYANLTISGQGSKTLTAATTVSNNLQVLGGNLVLGDFNLTVGNTASGSSSGYIRTNRTGRLTINNIDVAPKIFPIGNTTYNPVTVSKGSGLNWTAGVEDHWVTSNPGLNYLRDKAVLRTWSLIPSTNPPPAPADIQFEYNDGDPAQVGPEFDKGAGVQIWREAGDNWLTVGENLPPGGVANGPRRASISTKASFSYFAISNLDTPLPIRFRDVRVVQKQAANLIYFTNETEGGIEDYTLERSANGQTYLPIQVIRPLKNDGSSASYEVEDSEPLKAQSLYRVKGRERTGKTIYSPVVRAIHTESVSRITIVPNPADKGAISLQFSNVPQDYFILKLYNASGQLMMQQDLHHAGGSSSYPLSIEGLQPGTYLIELTGKEKLLQRFVIL